MIRISSACIKIVVSLIVISLAGVLRPIKARSEVHIKPILLVEEQYSDNFYRAETDEATVWVTRVSPGIDIDMFTERSRLALDYRFSYFWHQDNEDDIDASADDYAGHDFSLFAATLFFTRLTMGLDEVFFLTREPTSSDRFSQAVERNKYWQNRISPFTIYDLAENGEIKLSYRYEILNYIESRTPTEDSKEHRGILTLTYHLNSTNHLDLENQFWTRVYEGASSDYDSYQAKLIYRREFTDYLKGQVGAGYHRREFDNELLEDLDAFAFDASLVGETDITKISLFLEYNINDFTQGDAYFIAYRANLYLERLFFEAIRTYLGGYYQRSDYEFTPREDDTWNIRAGLGYRFLEEMFEISAEDSYTKRDSNETGREYEENQVFLRLIVVYDFAGK
ncbi:MAG: outer membrane beta-barrel protein [Desulfatiglandales bacterium]